MNEENKHNQEIEDLKEEVKNLTKKMKRQKWLNLYLISRKDKFKNSQ